MEVPAIIILVYIASTVGTITSFGTSTIMVPTLSLFYSFSPVLLFTGIIHGIGNLGKMYFFKSGIRWRLIFLFGIPGIIFSYLWSRIIPELSPQIILRVLGVFILVYVFYILKNPQWKLPNKNSTAVLGGSLTGISAAVFGVQGAVRAIFLSAFNLPKDVFIFTAGAIGIIIDITRIIGYFQNDFTLGNTLSIALLISVPVSIAGSFTGKKLIGKVSQKSFRTLIATALVVIALRYIIWG